MPKAAPSASTAAGRSCSWTIWSWCCAILTATPQGTFGCSIDPTAEGLARTKQFVAAIERQRRSSRASAPAWLKKLRNQMGRQSISVEGIDPRTRAARVLVEADYRMKLVGMGLEAGHAGRAQLSGPGQAAARASRRRRWTCCAGGSRSSTTRSAQPQDRNAFELRGSGVQVLSENELLTHLGQPVHTGKSDPLNQEFAERFTTQFRRAGEKVSGLCRLAERV